MQTNADNKTVFIRYVRVNCRCGSWNSHLDRTIRTVQYKTGAANSMAIKHIF